MKNPINNFLVSMIVVCSFNVCYSNTNNENAADSKGLTSEIAKNTYSAFEENKGQITDETGKAADAVLFRTTTPGTMIYITTYGISYYFMQDVKESESLASVPAITSKDGLNKEQTEQKFSWSRVDAVLQGAEIKKENVEYLSEPLQATFNYFYAHCPQGIYDVKKYSGIRINNVYPGIDWVLRVGNSGLKYDFVVHPGADYKKIIINYDGATDKVNSTDDNGFNVISTYGKINEGAPYCYLEASKQKINSKYIIKNKLVSFNISHYNSNETLVIDPSVIWATNVGYDNNSTELFRYIERDGNDEVFVVGQVYSRNGMPVMNPGGTSYFQGSSAQVYTRTTSPDLCIYKFSNNGAMLWGTLYGGTGSEMPEEMAIDNAGNLFIIGSVSELNNASPNMPLKNWSGAYFKSTLNGFGGSTPFILKFNNASNLIWATYYQGASVGVTRTRNITIGNNGEIFIVGFTGDAALPFSNPGGGAYFQQVPTGATDAFITEFNNAGAITWGTTWGGTSYDGAMDVAVDVFGSIYVIGSTVSTNFHLQTSPGAFIQSAYGGTSMSGSAAGDCFITKFNSSRAMAWSTYYGGAKDELASVIKIDNQGNVFVSGKTNSLNFPLANPGNGAYFRAALSSVASNSSDIFIIKFDISGQQLWSTYYGGNDDNYALDMFVDNCGNLSLLYSGNIYAGSNFPDSLYLRNPGGGYYYYPMNYNPNNNNYLNGWGNVGSVIFAKFTKNLTLAWATIFPGVQGASGGDFTYDSKNGLWIILGTGTNLPGNNSYSYAAWGQKVYYAGAYNQLDSNGTQDGIIMKFAPDTLTTQLSSTPDYCGSCNGSAQLSITSSNNFYPSYTWSTGQTNNVLQSLCTGIYSVTVTDLDCSVSIKTILVDTVNSRMANAITSLSNVSCNAGTNGSVRVSSSGGIGAMKYMWSNGLSTDSINTLAAGSYTLITTDSLGCLASLIVNITEPTPITLQATMVDVHCTAVPYGSAIANTSGGTSPYLYAWSNSATSSGIDSLQAGVYFVTITDGNGCVKTHSVTINSINSALATASAGNDITIDQGQSTQLNGSGGVGYLWMSSTGLSCTSCQDPIATVNARTTYSLIVTDEYGCTAMDSVTIFIGDYFTFYIPNTFTPNGDSKNDEFKPNFTNIEEGSYKFLIFDRWGNLIFETENSNKGWDGKANDGNELVQIDTYIWKATFKDNENAKHIYSGNVNLIR